VSSSAIYKAEAQIKHHPHRHLGDIGAVHNRMLIVEVLLFMIYRLFSVITDCWFNQRSSIDQCLFNITKQ